MYIQNKYGYCIYTEQIEEKTNEIPTNLIDYFDEEECEKIIAGKTKTEYMTYYEKSHSVVIKYELFQTSNVKWYSKIKALLNLEITHKFVLAYLERVKKDMEEV